MPRKSKSELQEIERQKWLAIGDLFRKNPNMKPKDVMSEFNKTMAAPDMTPHALILEHPTPKKRGRPPGRPTPIKVSRMSNVQFTTTKDKLIITIDLNAKGETSKTGKSTLIASTHGFINLNHPPRARVILNATPPR